ncbi:MAG: hypothetical protein K940chlam1_01186 [Candidatus Anoxychlamydiales bacterium]|nr:hypothetical protein [Candidatus Anoxychlamydiales bacterium]NGX35392.1 hypothetical protein [Candidatus Anoxychlamydiales bacterium]
MDVQKFVGRKQELINFQRLLKKSTASLVVIKGRRRIGKSRLIEEFGHNHPFYSFSGLSPTEKTTAQIQRNEFALLLSSQFNIPNINADDWSKLFMLLADKVQTGRKIILFDEITWMADKDPTFLSKLKNAWDLYFKKNPKLILILCGSVSSWIDKNIISSTGFFGRISEKITLKELTLQSCNKMLKNIGFKKSILEKFMILSITGGVPWYLEQIDPNATAIDNLRRLCFQSDGILVDEYKYIFSNLFGRRGKIYKKIVSKLAKQPAEFEEISLSIGYSASGILSDYINELIVSGFINKDTTWNLKEGKSSKLVKYRLCDNYLRFYLRYMAPKFDRIKSGQFADIDLWGLSGFQSVLGLQFENLVLNNRKSIWKELSLKPADIVYENPFFQRKTFRQKGCQIDYLIQTKFNSLYVCEMKFSKNEIKSNIINQMKDKISRLSIPRGFACIPVLIHVSGINEEIIETDYFGKIINFSDLLED